MTTRTTPNSTENEVSVTIKLSADPERTVTIPVTATGQGGATAADYSVPSSVVFNAGDTEKEVTFQASSDSVDDDGESVKLGFGPKPAGDGYHRRVSRRRRPYRSRTMMFPAVTVSFEQASYTVAEGSSETK